MDDFYLARQQEDTDKLLSFYSDKRLPEEWRSHLDHVVDSLGVVKNATFKNLEIYTVFSGRLAWRRQLLVHPSA